MEMGLALVGAFMLGMWFTYIIKDKPFKIEIKHTADAPTETTNIKMHEDQSHDNATNLDAVVAAANALMGVNIDGNNT